MQSFFLCFSNLQYFLPQLQSVNPDFHKACFQPGCSLLVLFYKRNLLNAINLYIFMCIYLLVNQIYLICL